MFHLLEVSLSTVAVALPLATICIVCSVITAFDLALCSTALYSSWSTKLSHSLLNRWNVTCLSDSGSKAQKNCSFKHATSPLSALELICKTMCLVNADGSQVLHNLTDDEAQLTLNG